jgi:hypothetical protein
VVWEVRQHSSRAQFKNREDEVQSAPCEQGSVSIGGKKNRNDSSNQGKTMGKWSAEAEAKTISVRMGKLMGLTGLIRSGSKIHARLQ